MARLPKGAETTVSMTFLVMCAEKIPRLLCLFFVAIYDWFCTWNRVGELWLGPKKFPGLRQANRWLLYERDFQLLSPPVPLRRSSGLTNYF